MTGFLEFNHNCHMVPRHSYISALISQSQSGKVHLYTCIYTHDHMTMGGCLIMSLFLPAYCRYRFTNNSPDMFGSFYRVLGHANGNNIYLKYGGGLTSGYRTNMCCIDISSVYNFTCYTCEQNTTKCTDA